MVERTPAVVVRAAQADDAQAITDILRSIDYFTHIAAEAPAQTQERVATQLSHALTATSQGSAGHTILVAERCMDGDDAAQAEVIGYCAIHWVPNLALGADGYVSELFVRDDARGQGAGALLLDAARLEAQKRQCVRLFLINVRTRESYKRGFYRKQQWVEWSEAAVFRLPLPQ